MVSIESATLSGLIGVLYGFYNFGVGFLGSGLGFRVQVSKTTHVRRETVMRGRHPRAKDAAAPLGQSPPFPNIGCLAE